MKKFTEPEVEIIELEVADIVTASGSPVYEYQDELGWIGI